MINLKDLKIYPCSGCNYECFDQSSACPIKDDVDYVYNKILLSDIVIMAIPTYSDAPPAVYFALKERSQGIFTHNTKYDHYRKISKGYIVFGNEKAGGKEVVRILSQDTEGLAEILLLQSHEYGQNSIEGRLLDISDVKSKLANFLNKLLQRV